MEKRLERAPLGVIQTTSQGTVTGINETAREILDCEEGSPVDGNIETIIPESVENRVVRAFDGDDPTDSFEEYYPGPDMWVDVSIVGTGEDVTIYLQDVTERHHRRRRLETIDSDIERLTIINELISDILAELVAASSREEIAETICTRLGETDIYEFAWVGERELGGDDIVIRAAAGRTGRTFECIQRSIEESTTLPEEQVIETGEPTIVGPLGDDSTVPEAVRRASFADGLQSLLALPLTYGSSVYGVVGVYAADQDAFSERERSNFGTLGEMAGFAVNATRHRNLLLSDTVVELTVEFRDREGPLVVTSRSIEGSLTVDGLVAQGDQLLCYVTVDGMGTDELDGVFEEREAVVESRIIAAGEEEASLEVLLEDTAPLARLLSLGVTFESATFEQGVGRVVVEVPPDEDVRRIGDVIGRDLSGQVIAKRERERSITTAEEFRDELGDRLTDRQETALRTAFFADYFESPRGSSAQEVAGALDITGPTLLHHLRAGQWKLLSEFFDAGPDSER